MTERPLKLHRADETNVIAGAAIDAIAAGEIAMSAIEHTAEAIALDPPRAAIAIFDELSGIPAPAAGGPKFGLGSLLGVAPAKEASSDEAALAGKGFTPEVESSYRQKHPEMKFAEVDKVEAVKVDSAKLQAFIKEGGLAQ